MENAHIYTVPMVNQTVVADATLVIVHAAAAITTRASLLEVLRCTVSQEGTDTPDNLGVILAQKVTAFGTYTATTPQPHVIGGAASGIAGATTGAAATAGTDASAEGAGAVTTIHTESFNNINGYIWVPTPKERLIVTADTAFILKLRGTPATLTGWNASVTFQELN